MSRLETWLDEECRILDSELASWPGALDANQRQRYREQLAASLHGQQLAVADAAGELGATLYAALREHSNRLRDLQLREWFRRHW